MNSATTAPALASTPPAPAAPVAPRPVSGGRVSPLVRHYLSQQKDSIDAVGGTEEDFRQLVQMTLKKPLTAIPPVTLEHAGVDVPGNLRGVSMALVQGATVGFGDEAVGSILGKLTGVGARQGIKEYRAEYAAWAEKHAGTAFAAELAGGIGVGLLTMGASAPATAASLTRGTGMAILRGMGTGAVWGALGGAGASESDDPSWNMLGDRMQAALAGAGAGLVFGGALGYAGARLAPLEKAVGTKITESPTFIRAANAVRDIPVLNRLESLTPEGRAREILVQWMQHTGKTADDLHQLAASYWARGQRPTIVDLMGEQFTPFAQNVLKDRTPAVQAAVRLFEQRQAEQGDRLLGQLSMRVLDNPKLGMANAYRATDNLLAEREAATAPLYKRAHEQVVKVTDDMRTHMEQPEFADAWNSMVKDANDQLDLGRATGLRVAPFDRETVAQRDALRTRMLGNNPSPTSRAFVDANFPALQLIPDEVPVRGIDAMVQTLQEPINKRFGVLDRWQTSGDTRTRYDVALSNMRERYKQILGEAFRQVPVFGEARAAFSGPSASRDAINAGLQMFKERAPDYYIRKELAALAPGDRDFFRLGAMQHIHERMLASNDPLADVAAQMFGAKGVMRSAEDRKLQGQLNGDARRILALFGAEPDLTKAPAAAQDLFRVIAGEAAVSRTTGGSLSLPQNVSTQKLIQAGVGNPPAVRGRLGVDIVAAANQEVVRDQANLAQAENNALAELFSRGMRNPRELKVLIDHLGYDAKRKPLKLGRRVLGQTVRQGVAALVKP